MRRKRSGAGHEPAELADVAASMDLGILRDPDRLHGAWLSSGLDQARMLLRVVLHSVRVLPPQGQGCQLSVYVLLSGCCFHWVGEKPQPLRKDIERLDGTVWYHSDGPDPVALAA